MVVSAVLRLTLSLYTTKMAIYTPIHRLSEKFLADTNNILDPDSGLENHPQNIHFSNNFYF